MTMKRAVYSHKIVCSLTIDTNSNPENPESFEQCANCYRGIPFHLPKCRFTRIRIKAYLEKEVLESPLPSPQGTPLSY